MERLTLWLLRSNVTRMDRDERQDAGIPGIDRPLTSEECRELAASFMDLPPQFRISREELEMLQQDTHGKVMSFGAPQKGADAMRRWLASLRAAKAKTLSTLDDCSDSLRRRLLQDLDQLNREIALADRRLADYQFQLDQGN